MTYIEQMAFSVSRVELQVSDSPVEHEAAGARVDLQPDREFGKLGFVVRQPSEVLDDCDQRVLGVQDLNFVVVERDGDLLALDGDVQRRAPHPRQKLPPVLLPHVPLDEHVLRPRGVEVGACRREGDRVHRRVVPVVQRRHRVSILEQVPIQEEATGHVAGHHRLFRGMARDTRQLFSGDVFSALEFASVVVDKVHLVALH